MIAWHARSSSCGITHMAPGHTKSSSVTSTSVSYKKRHEARAEITLLSLGGRQHSSDIASSPYPPPGAGLRSVLQSARHHRQSQVGLRSAAASLLPITMLAQSAMAADCTRAGTHGRNNRDGEQKNFRARQRPKCSPRRALKAPGLSDWLLRQNVAFDWLSKSRARLRKAELEAP